MKDAFEDVKKAAREQAMREANLSKNAFIREIKGGLGKQMVQELEKIKPPTKWQLFVRRLNKILGI